MPVVAHRPIRHLLIVRFSALGDVAMTVPVIDTLARRYPQLEVTVLSRPVVSPLFDRMPPNVRFRSVDLQSDYQGTEGLRRLCREMIAEGVDGLADFHGVLRTYYMHLLFRLSGLPAVSIRKGRRAKRRLIRHTPNAFVQLPTSVERYCRVLRCLGFAVRPDFRSLYAGEPLPALPDGCGVSDKLPHELWIGVAPFSAHRGKTYPPDMMEMVIEKLAAFYPAARLFVFSGPEDASPWRERWEERFPRLLFVHGRLGGLGGELALMARLDVMVSMDSANMHLASLVAVPVVSIWGATHPFVGFMGYGQTIRNAVQVDLLCRPCSVFGNRSCRRGDYACLTLIPPDSVVSRVTEVLQSGSPSASA